AQREPGRSHADASPRHRPGGGAARLSGLPDRRRRGTRSPVSAAPPGKQAAEYFRPGLFPARGVNALAGLPDRRRQGTRSPVSAARSPAKRSASREEATPMHHPDTVPEAALRACPGYRIA
ncbi:hypothetical protein, partial [Klebsiella michiganensis]|uniref:hypothetical protein n=1 Tax=Klebsiella michiganensis TaxID=1134687 RepID=UPI0015B033F6